MSDIIITDKIERVILAAEKLGITTVPRVRNLRIRDQYNKLRKEGKDYMDSVTELADKHFLAFKTIEGIIGTKTNSKKKHGRRKRNS